MYFITGRFSLFLQKWDIKESFLLHRGNLEALICRNLGCGNWQLPRWHSDKPSPLSLCHAIKNLCGNQDRDNDDDDGDGRETIWRIFAICTRFMVNSELFHTFTRSPTLSFCICPNCMEQMVLFNNHVTLIC